MMAASICDLAPVYVVSLALIISWNFSGGSAAPHTDICLAEETRQSSPPGPTLQPRTWWVQARALGTATPGSRLPAEPLSEAQLPCLKQQATALSELFLENPREMRAEITRGKGKWAAALNGGSLTRMLTESESEQHLCWFNERVSSL